MAKKYRVSTAAKIESVLDYCAPDKKNSVKALMSMAKREVSISTKFNLSPGHLIYLMPRMSKMVTRIQAAPVTHLVPPGAPSWHPISFETFCD